MLQLTVFIVLQSYLGNMFQYHSTIKAAASIMVFNIIALFRYQLLFR